MYLIRFDDNREWWVSSRAFDRLFEAALIGGHLPRTLEDWQHVAAAHGGFALSRTSREEAEALTTGLRAAANAELTRLADVVDPVDMRYRDSLHRLVQALRDA